MVWLKKFKTQVCQRQCHQKGLVYKQKRPHAVFFTPSPFLTFFHSLKKSQTLRGGMFWLKSEPILGKTPTLTFSPPPAAAGRNKTEKSARAQKIFFEVWGKRKFFAPSSSDFLFQKGNLIIFFSFY